MLRNRSAITRSSSSNNNTNNNDDGNAKGGRGKQSFGVYFVIIVLLLMLVVALNEFDVYNKNGNAPTSFLYPELKLHGLKGSQKKKENNDTDTTSSSSTSHAFPSPMPNHDEINYKILLEPTFGKHRSDQNAVFAFAEGYDLNTYVLFIESLHATPFTGDIVLSVSHLEKLKPGVEEYLRTKADKSNVVVYSVDWTCFKKNGDPANDARDGMNDCKVDHVFGKLDGTPVEDPRIPRPVATARYDIYWVWATQYMPLSQILLIDVRDTYFQQDPFVNLPSSSSSSSGILQLYGENKDSVTIYKSSYNRSWIRSAYGQKVLDDIKDHTVSCSGSTIGEKVALESYLRAMISEFEETKCKMKGCDQGFHNYLYRMRKLYGAAGISKVVFNEQGEGNVNNLSAMRDKPLTEWGVFDKDRGVVLNWDQKLSPVVHQFDRDDELKQFVNKKRNAFVKIWNKSKQ